MPVVLEAVKSGALSGHVSNKQGKHRIKKNPLARAATEKLIKFAAKKTMPTVSKSVAALIAKVAKRRMSDPEHDIVRHAVHEGLDSSIALGGGNLTQSNDRGMVLSYPDKSGIANDSTMTNSFQMSNLPKSDPFYEFASDSVKVKGVEYISTVTSVNSQVGQTIFTLSFNPLSWEGTRLARYASMYNYFRFDKVEVIYEPIVPKTVGGSLLGAILPNTAKQIPVNGIEGLRASMELRSSVMHPVYSVQTLTYRFSTPTQPYLCVPVDSAQTPYEHTLSEQGRLFYKDASGLDDNTYGQILIKYEIAFYDSCLSKNEANIFYKFNTVISFQSAADPGMLLTSTTAGVVPAQAFAMYYMITALADAVVPNLPPFYAGRTYVWQVFATSTGVGGQIYDSLVEAIAGQQYAYRGKLPSLTTGVIPFSLIALRGFGPTEIAAMKEAATAHLEDMEAIKAVNEDPWLKQSKPISTSSTKR